MKKLIYLLLITLFVNSVVVSYCQSIGYDSLAPLILKDRTGLINAKGEVVLEPIYTHSQYRLGCNDFVRVWVEDKVGFIDRRGDVRIPVGYDNLSFFHSGVSMAYVSGKVGFINSSGSAVIPFQYDLSNIVFYKSNLIEGLILLQDSSFNYGFIDTTNAVIIPFIYEDADVFLDGHAVVGKYNDGEIRYGLINKENKTTIPFSYSSLSYEYENIYYAYRQLLEPIDSVTFNPLFGMGVIDSNNRVIIPFDYDSIRPRLYYRYIADISCHPLQVENHLACFKYDTGWSILNLKGKQTACCYEAMRDINQGNVAAKKGAWGLIDTAGTIKIPFLFDQVDIKINGIVAVRMGSKWAYWNTDGKQLSDFIYDYVTEYREGLALVKVGKKYQLIDINGKEFLKKIPLDYEDYAFHPVQGTNTLLFRKGKKYGLMDFKGKVLFPAKAEEVILFEQP